MVAELGSTANETRRLGDGVSSELTQLINTENENGEVHTKEAVKSMLKKFRELFPILLKENDVVTRLTQSCGIIDVAAVVEILQYSHRQQGERNSSPT